MSDNVAKREELHLQLCNKIQELRDSIGLLRILVDKVGANPVPDQTPSPDKTSAPKLAAVLAQAPGDIHLLSQELRELTNNLNELLF